MSIPTTLLATLLVVFAAHAATAEYVRGCYFTNWAQYRPGKGKYVPEDYQSGLCTHILFAFGWMNNDNTVRAHDQADVPTSWKPKGMYARVNDLKQQQPGLKTLLSIGGWTFGTALFTSMSNSATGRRTFINSAMKFLTQHGFDGLDIDWEYPKGAKQNYVKLLQEARAAFDAHQPRLLLTAAVGAAPATVDAAYSPREMGQTLDLIFLMSYDFHGAWEQGTGLNSPLHGGSHDKPEHKDFNTANSAAYWVRKGLPKNKLVIGIGCYGRGWKLRNPSNNGLGAPTSGAAPKRQYSRENGYASYYELCEMEKQGAKKTYDRQYGAPYLSKGGEWFGYDDVQSVTEKMQFVKREGYAGAFVWTLDLDDFTGSFCGQGKYPLINAIRRGLGGGGPPQPNTTRRPPRTTTRRTWKPQTTTRRTWAPRTTTKKSGGGGGGGGNCSKDGFFAKPSDCSKYYRCVSGHKYSYSCPAGLKFNEKMSYCDWPSNVSC